jgi:glycosyltransferase involved in cell wall biosynthesis
MRVIIGIATTGDRQEYLEKTLESLENQDTKCEVWVYDNSKNPDYTDNAKFYFLNVIKEPCYYFSCDDDIIYPSDYVSKTIRAIEEHKCIVTYHGRILRGLNRSYYKGHTALACRHHFPQTVELDVGGSGVMAWRTDYFNPVGIHRAEDQCMADLVISLEATKQGKKIMHIGHKGNWIVAQDLPKGSTIYEQHHLKCERQSEIADEIWKLKNK